MTKNLITYEDATRFEVSCLPLGNAARRHFTIVVEWRGPDSWAVLNEHGCWSREGQWDWESMPSTRTDEWIADHRFTLTQALALAHQFAPNITVMGRDVQFALDNPDYI